MSETSVDSPFVGIRKKVQDLLRLGNNSPEDVRLIEEIMQISGMSEGLPANKEVANRERSLGKAFQTEIGHMPDEYLPPVFTQAMGASGQLSTNEDMTDDLIENTASKSNHPDGYVYGAGFGNILSMSLLFPENVLPKAILAVDVLPDVVLTGRIVTNLLEQSQDFSDFETGLMNPDSIEQQFNRVIDVEENPTIKQRFLAISPERLSLEIGKIVMRESLPKSGFKQESYGGGERVNVLAVIRDKFAGLKQLAAEGNIGVAYADMTDPYVLKKVKEMVGFEGANNIVYMSNVIDHLTNRGYDLTHINDMDVLKALGEGNNLFVHTTQVGLDYRLVADNNVPSYSQSDLRR